jgi:ribonuclease HII
MLISMQHGTSFMFKTTNPVPFLDRQRAYVQLCPSYNERFKSQRPHHYSIIIFYIGSANLIGRNSYFGNMTSGKSSLHGIAGIDEAGRGPMIGPLVACGVLLDNELIEELKKIGVKDSKALTPKKRENFAVEIRKLAIKIEIKSISAQQIDQSRKRGRTLNEIEVDLFSAIVEKLRPKIAYLDAADVIAGRFGNNIGERSGLLKEGCKIISEHKADTKYTVVAAASIIAKTTRDKVIAKYHEVYGDFGSGYPSDSKTVDFVRNLVMNGKELPDMVRRSWKSVSTILNEDNTKQMQLDL